MALVDRGNGLIYDTDINITWLQDANYAKTCGYSPDGSFAKWADAVQWVTNLRFAGYSGWRLPTAQPGCLGEGCSAGELGHLWLVEGPQLKPGSNPFINIQTGVATGQGYWTSTEVDSTQVYVWNTGALKQATSNKTPTGTVKLDHLFVWPVRNGDSPIPPVSIRFVDRIVSLIPWIRRKTP